MRVFLVFFVAFLIMLWVSASAYPGGTWYDRSAEGFSFWGNYWCDLLHARAYNRAANDRSMWLARVAFWLFAGALLRFWPLAATLSDRAGVRRWVTTMGVSGAAALFFVTLFSSRSEPVWHAVFVVLSALLGVIAASILSIALFRVVDVGTRALSVLLIGSALLSVGQYVRQGITGEAALWLPGAQKITTLFLLLFMLRCAALWRDRGSREEPEKDGAEPA